MKLTKDIEEKEYQKINKVNFSKEVLEDIKEEYLSLMLEKGIKYSDGRSAVEIDMFSSDVIGLMVDSVGRLKPIVTLKRSFNYSLSGIFIGSRELCDKPPLVYHALMSNDPKKFYNELHGVELSELIDFPTIDNGLHKYVMSFGFGCQKRESSLSGKMGHIPNYTASYKKFRSIVQNFESGETPKEHNSSRVFSLVFALALIFSFVVILKNCGG